MRIRIRHRRARKVERNQPDELVKKGVGERKREEEEEKEDKKGREKQR